MLYEISISDPLQTLVVIAGTAAIVSASAFRQEALSGRMRLLTAEFRKLFRRKHPGRFDSERLTSLAEQIPEFESRLHRCIQGHIFLYSTLLLEVFLYGAIFFLKGIYEERKWFCFALVCLTAFIGVGYHLLEYASSHKTTRMETADITAHIYELRHPKEPEPEAK